MCIQLFVIEVLLLNKSLVFFDEMAIFTFISMKNVKKQKKVEQKTKTKWKKVQKSLENHKKILDVIY